MSGKQEVRLENYFSREFINVNDLVRSIGMSLSMDNSRRSESLPFPNLFLRWVFISFSSAVFMGVVLGRQPKWYMLNGLYLYSAFLVFVT